MSNCLDYLPLNICLEEWGKTMTITMNDGKKFYPIGIITVEYPHLVFKAQIGPIKADRVKVNIRTVKEIKND